MPVLLELRHEPLSCNQLLQGRKAGKYRAPHGQKIHRQPLNGFPLCCFFLPAHNQPRNPCVNKGRASACTARVQLLTQHWGLVTAAPLQWGTAEQHKEVQQGNGKWQPGMESDLVNRWGQCQPCCANVGALATQWHMLFPLLHTNALWQFLLMQPAHGEDVVIPFPPAASNISPQPYPPVAV